MIKERERERRMERNYTSNVSETATFEIHDITPSFNRYILSFDIR